MSYVAIGAGVIAILALAYAVYSIRAVTTQTLSTSAALTEAGRNLVAAEKARDTAVARADKAEAELADATAQLKATQEALAKAQQENAKNAADSVRNADDPLAVFNDELRAEANPGVSNAADASAGHGDQGKPAV